MKEYLIILKPQAIVSRFPSSDTIFGGICWSYRTLFPERFERFINSWYEGKPCFIISSAFPMIHNKETRIFFLPKPSGCEPSNKELEQMREIHGRRIVEVKYSSKMQPHLSDKCSMLEILSYWKKFKKLRYISSSLFIEMAEGRTLSHYFSDYLESLYSSERNEHIVLKGCYLLKARELDSVKDSFIMPREIPVQKNSIDRLYGSTSGAGQTYYEDSIFLGKSMNLYFLIRTDDIEELKSVLRFQAETGIGCNRSTGANTYDIAIEESPFSFDTHQGSRFLTLSRYIPCGKSQDINIADDSEYDLLPVRSKVESREEFKSLDIWKNRIICCKEGSCFSIREQREFWGAAPEVKILDGKRIIQYGYAYPVFGKWGSSS